MQRTLTEKKVLKKLGITDFRHMTKDKVVSFVSMLPRMDPEVAKAALAQFPEFKDLAKDIVNELKRSFDTIIAENEKSQDAFYKACDRILTMLESELKVDNLTSEDRDRIEDKMIEVAQMMSEKDSENKQWIGELFTKLGFGCLFVLAGVGAAIGINAQVNGNALDDIDEDDITDIYK